MSDRSQLTGSVRPAKYQPPLPVDQLILREAPRLRGCSHGRHLRRRGARGARRGHRAGPSREEGQERRRGLGDVEIGVLEKAGQLGEHSLSGAVVNPRAFRELFPELDMSELPLRGPVTKEAVYFLTESRSVRIPTPPTMKNHGNQVASLCEIVRWLGEKGRSIGGERLYRLRRGRTARGGRPGHRCAHDGLGTGSGRTARRQRLHASHGPDRAGHRCRGGHTGTPDAGVPRVAGDRGRESPNLCAGG